VALHLHILLEEVRSVEGSIQVILELLGSPGDAGT